MLSRGGHGGDPPQKLARHHNALVTERERSGARDANDQHVEVTADFRHYIDDPHVDPGSTRKPLTDAVDGVIVGGDFGGNWYCIDIQALSATLRRLHRQLDRGWANEACRQAGGDRWHRSHGHRVGRGLR
jgi:hypothetical protein